MGSGRHAAFVKQVAQAKRKLHMQPPELYLEQAAELVQEVAQTEVRRLAEMIRRYATHRIKEAQVALQALQASDVFQEASECEAFEQWLECSCPDVGSGTDAASFYRTFFQTQLCLDFSNEEIRAQMEGEI